MTEQPTYEALLAEVMRLRAENAELKKRLGITDTPPKQQLSLEERIALFMSLFTSRQDVWAHRWESKNVNYLAQTHYKDRHSIRITDHSLASSLLEHISPDAICPKSLFDA